MDVDLKQVDKGKVKAFFNFDLMLLPLLVKVIFAVGMVLLVLGAIAQPFLRAFVKGMSVTGGQFKETLNFDFGGFLWGTVISVIMLVLGTLWLRIVCESMIILFKIHEALVPKKAVEAAPAKAEPPPPAPAAEPPKS